MHSSNPRRQFLLATLSLVMPMLAIFSVPAGGDDKPASSVSASKPAANMPSAAVGSWKYGSISPLWVKDLTTGMLSSSRQMGSFYEFERDGTFKHFVLISFNNTGWKNGTFTEEYGKADFDPQNGTVTLTVTRGKYRVMDNRVTKNNYTRDMTHEELKKHSGTVTFKLSTAEDGKPRLELSHAKNEGSTTYSRWETADEKAAK